MAEGQPRGGCFKCGNYDHSAWECRVPVDKAVSSTNRQTIQDQHKLDHPASAKEQARSRMNKLFSKMTMKEESRDVSWTLVGAEVERLIDFFVEKESDMEKVAKTFVQLDGDSAEIKARKYCTIHEKVGEKNESTRLIVACVREKYAEHVLQGGSLQSLDLQTRIIFEKSKDLTEIRNRVWDDVVRKTNVSRNVNLTLVEFRQLRDDIHKWCHEYTQWCSTKATPLEYTGLDQQILELKANFMQMQKRAEYLNTWTTLQTQIQETLCVIKSELDKALILRSSLENESFTCPACSQLKIGFLLRCGHGLCVVCHQSMRNCKICGSTDMTATLLKHK